MSDEIFLVYARSANGAIGLNGRLPWHLPADLKHFKALTIGKPMIMGRKTFDSLPGPLPDRRNIVLTRRDDWNPEGADVVGSPDEALVLAQANNDTGAVAIVGGAAIYDVFRPRAVRIEVTEIKAHYPGDTFMKPLGPEWREVRREDHDAVGERPAFAFVSYRRIEERANRGGAS